MKPKGRKKENMINSETKESSNTVFYQGLIRRLELDNLVKTFKDIFKSRDFQSDLRYNRRFFTAPIEHLSSSKCCHKDGTPLQKSCFKLKEEFKLSFIIYKTMMDVLDVGGNDAFLNKTLQGLSDSPLFPEDFHLTKIIKQIQTTIKRMILNLGNEGIDEIPIPIKLLDEDGLDELQFQLQELREKVNDTKKDLSIELISHNDSIRKLMKTYNFSMEQITKVFDYYDFILVLDAFSVKSTDEQSLVEQFLATKPFDDTTELVHLFKSELVKFGRKFKNNLQVIFSNEVTFNRFLVELYLFKGDFVTEESLQKKNNYNLSFVSERIKNLTYKELFEVFSSVTDIFIKHRNIKLFIFDDITEVLENSQLEFDFTIDAVTNRTVLASKIPDFYSKTHKKLFTKFPITFNLTLEQTSKPPYIKDWWEFEDILFFIESKIPEAPINISIELANWSDLDKVVSSQPLTQIEGDLKTELQNLFKATHQNLTLVDLKLNCKWE